MVVRMRQGFKSLRKTNPGAYEDVWSTGISSLFMFGLAVLAAYQNLPGGVAICSMTGTLVSFGFFYGIAQAWSLGKQSSSNDFS